MKYLLMLLVASATAVLVGCAPKEEANTATSPASVASPQQSSKVNPMNDPNVPPQVRQMMAEQQKQHR